MSSLNCRSKRLAVFFATGLLVYLCFGHEVAGAEYKIKKTKWGKIIVIDPEVKKTYKSASISLVGLEEMQEYQAAPTTPHWRAKKGNYFLALHFFAEERDGLEVHCLAVELIDSKNEKCECGWEEGSVGDASGRRRIMLLFAVKNDRVVHTIKIGEISFDVRKYSESLMQSSK